MVKLELYQVLSELPNGTVVNLLYNHTNEYDIIIDRKKYNKQGYTTKMIIGTNTEHQLLNLGISLHSIVLYFVNSTECNSVNISACKPLGGK